jgi:hypothetical protein
MGQTPKYGLRFPEREDPAEAWTAVGNLAGDVERMYSGTAAVPVCSSGWAWFGAAYGDGIAIRSGRVVTVDGLLKRTGPPLTLSATPEVLVPAFTVPWAPDPSRSFTGPVMLPNAQFIRWYLTGSTSTVSVLHPGGTPTYSIGTGGYVSIAIRYVTAA